MFFLGFKTDLEWWLNGILMDFMMVYLGLINRNRDLMDKDQDLRFHRQNEGGEYKQTNVKCTV